MLKIYTIENFNKSIFFYSLGESGGTQEAERNGGKIKTVKREKFQRKLEKLRAFLTLFSSC